MGVEAPREKDVRGQSWDVVTSPACVSVLLPVKELRDAKLRLSRVLSQEQRGRLVLAMLEDVAAAVRGAGFVVTVVSPDVRVLDRADAVGARPMPQDPRARTLNQALARAISATAPTRAILVILPDTPLVSSTEIRALVSAESGGAEAWSSAADVAANGGAGLPREGRPRVAIAPDRAGRGTNALYLRPPRLIRPAFGRGSLARHRRASESVGVQAAVCRLPGLALDVDAPSDIAALLEVASDTATHRLLREIAE
ncbi:MAG TPA: 2-phospho-L-lactate guanylyltransferase [Chloroflexota bacterium]|nr:2-phospho-L-lactate guanylyltransferase [Chloroflexota bacterium]